MSVHVVSDLHLGAGPQAAARAHAFARFVDHLRRDGVGQRLVLNGDCFELLGRPMTAAASTRRLQDLAGSVPEVFDALRAARRAGVRVDVVAGNHDPTLAHPDVAETLRCLVDGVAVHPRGVTIDGVVRVEHGHHHHAGNAPITADGVAPLPLLGAFDAARTAGATRATAALATARACLADPRVARPAPQVVRRALLRGAGRLGPSQRGDYLHHAARAHGTGAAVHVFGHTHIAEMFPLRPDDSRSWYANPGSWLSGRATFVSVTYEPGAPVALALREFDPVDDTVRERETAEIAALFSVQTL